MAAQQPVLPVAFLAAQQPVLPVAFLAAQQPVFFAAQQPVFLAAQPVFFAAQPVGAAAAAFGAQPVGEARDGVAVIAAAATTEAPTTVFRALEREVDFISGLLLILE